MRKLFSAALLAALLPGCAAPPAPGYDARVWTLRDATRVGGHTTQVVGNPTSGAGANAGLVFDGEGDGVFVPANPLAAWRAFTIEVRFRPAASDREEQRFLHVEDELKHRVLMETRVRDGQWSLDTFLFQDAQHKLTLLDRSKEHPTDRWYWVALVYDGAKMSSYVNGVVELSGEVEFPPMVGGRTSIGVRQNRVSWFSGAISEIRFTPAALPAHRLRVSP
jgi:hypothetical protein